LVFGGVALFGAREFDDLVLQLVPEVAVIARFQLLSDEFARGRAHVVGRDSRFAESRFGSLGFIEAVITRDDVVQRIKDAQRRLAFLEEIPLLFHANSPCGRAFPVWTRPPQPPLNWRGAGPRHQGGGTGTRVK